MDKYRAAVDQTPAFFSRAVGALALSAPAFGIVAGHALALVERIVQNIDPKLVDRVVCSEPPSAGVAFNAMRFGLESMALFALPLLPLALLSSAAWRRNDKQPYPVRDAVMSVGLATLAAAAFSSEDLWHHSFPGDISTELAAKLCTGVAVGLAARSAILYGSKATKLLAFGSSAAFSWSGFYHTALSSFACYGQETGQTGLMAGAIISALTAAPVWYGAYTVNTRTRLGGG